jgi:starch-binding outer membrane protein, SusD/RagB family
MSFFTSNRAAREWLRHAAGVAALGGVLAAGACGDADFLVVEDPDIINPSDVQSTAGANAVRLGALARFNAATSGGESLFLLGGLFADEWVNGDSFIARQEIDQRVITEGNNFLTDANRVLHRARLSAEQAIALLQQYDPAAPAWQVAEMHFVQGYVVNLLAENLCDGLVLSGVVDGREQYGTPVTTASAFERALGHANDGLGLITGNTANDVRVRSALQATRGRILMNLNRPADALQAVSGVATNFQYVMLHSQTTQSNWTWIRNNSERRYSVGNLEGGNGMNFATAGDPRVPVCVGGSAACIPVGGTNARRDDLSQPFHVQMLWGARESSVAIIRGVDARMIEAEAQLRAGNAAASLATLNAARATVPGLAPLVDAGTPQARLDQLFRERAFWQFGRGYRVGDMRRLVRQHGRPANTVFPTGAWHKSGNYGSDVNMPVPLAERNNPNVPGSGEICINRNA